MKYVMFKVAPSIDQFVIGRVAYEDNLEVIVEEPMTIDVYYTGGQLDMSASRWMPFTADGRVTIFKPNLLAVCAPSDTMIDYYEELLLENPHNRKALLVKQRLQNLRTQKMDRQANAPFTSDLSS